MSCSIFYGRFIYWYTVNCTVSLKLWIHMEGSKLYGVELDDVSGRIARQLYQRSSVAIQGFEKAEFSDNFFDVAIGNVPFGQFKVADRRYDRLNLPIHEYFIAKTLDKVRPGGVVAFVTSSYTMDKRTSNTRKYIAQRAELLGAVRLPNNAFKAAAGTEVVSDILFLQKRDRMVFTTDGRWFWNSHSLKGRAIEFIMAYEDKTLPEAVLILNHAEGQTHDDVKNGVRSQYSATRQKPVHHAAALVEKVPFKLPAQADDFRRMFGYLCGTRKLDQDILKELIRQSNLYESVYRYVDKSTGELKEIHNAVFVGKDEHGEPKSAFQRGLSSLGQNTTYKRDVPGSDPSAPFLIPGRKGTDTVIVFEASIDAISHGAGGYEGGAIHSGPVLFGKSRLRGHCN